MDFGRNLFGVSEKDVLKILKIKKKSVSLYMTNLFDPVIKR